MKRLSVVIPVYYNEQSLPLLFSELTKVEQVLLAEGVQVQLIFVDDGSGDGSLGELLEIKRQRESAKVIRLARNFGAIQAVKAGLQFVTGDCFMMLAADLQDPPDLIPDMVDKWLGGAKYVLCAREARDDPIFTRMLASTYYKLLRFSVVRGYPAGGYDMALMDQALLPYLQNSGRNINISLFAYWLGFEPEIIYYKRRRRVHGRSRWTFSKRVKLFADSLLGFSVVPIRLISLIGALVSVASFGYGCLVVINAMLGRSQVPGFPTIVASISFLLGLVIITLGVIGEYVWRILDEVSSRPESVIDEVY